VHAGPCCPATVYAVLLWLYLLSAFGKIKYIHTYILHKGGLKEHLAKVIVVHLPGTRFSGSSLYC